MAAAPSKFDGSPKENKEWSLRLASNEDAPILERLIHLSARVLQAPFYSAAQIEAAFGPVFGVDLQLIADGTYFVAVTTNGAELVGCGGWSKRQARFGGSHERTDDQSFLDPKCDAARIRAFFVHPDWTRKGIARAILVACESAIGVAGFHQIELVATLAGVPLYSAFDYEAGDRYNVPLRDGLRLPVVPMRKQLFRARPA